VVWVGASEQGGAVGPALAGGLACWPHGAFHLPVFVLAASFSLATYARAGPAALNLLLYTALVLSRRPSSA